jgi:tetratricopeptide (TPR) repeat protein
VGGVAHLYSVPQVYVLRYKEATMLKWLNLPSLLAETLWRRGMIFIFVGEYDSADECLRSALEITSLEEENRYLQALLTAALAKNRMFRGEYAAAIPRFEECVLLRNYMERAGQLLSASRRTRESPGIVSESGARLLRERRAALHQITKSVWQISGTSISIVENSSWPSRTISGR